MAQTVGDLLFRNLVSGSIPSPRFNATQALRPFKGNRFPHITAVLPTLFDWIRYGWLDPVGEPTMWRGFTRWEAYNVTQKLADHAAKVMSGFEEHNELKAVSYASGVTEKRL